MKKNANGEGSIYKWTKNGKPAGYKGAISYPDEDGRTKRYFAYGHTRKDVRDKARQGSQSAERWRTRT